jgi:myotubularin-related protein 6/7/8
MHVATVQKLPLSTVGAPLQIRCKTFLSVTFVLPRERECHDLYTSLMQMSQPCREKNFMFLFQIEVLCVKRSCFLSFQFT